jgi:hypothetical protein
MISNMKKYLLLFFLILLAIDKGFSQTDTIIIYKTDTVFVTEKQDIMYKMFVENKETEIKHLWKMNLVDLGLVRPNISYEQRLSKALSVELSISAGLKGNLYLKSELTSVDLYPTFEFEQQFKYYYNLNRRNGLGKKTNGFSGNYFATSFWYNKNYDPTWKDQGKFYSTLENYNLGIKHGIQRRVGNIGYIDFYFGFYYRWGTNHSFSNNPDFANLLKLMVNYHIVPVVGIKAGFAIDSKENLKRLMKN